MSPEYRMGATKPAIRRLPIAQAMISGLISQVGLFDMQVLV
jgi:hypothetical protein